MSLLGLVAVLSGSVAVMGLSMAVSVGVFSGTSSAVRASLAKNGASFTSLTVMVTPMLLSSFESELKLRSLLSLTNTAMW